LVIFPLAPVHIIAQMWSNGVQGADSVCSRDTVTSSTISCIAADFLKLS